MKTLAESLRGHLESHPSRLAIALQHAGQPDRHLTYEELWAGAARFAGAYSGRGLRKGDVVVLILPHGENLVRAFWGAVLGGLTPSIMPFLTEKLSATQYRSDIKSLVTVTRPTAVVTYPEFLEEVREATKDLDAVPQIIATDEPGLRDPASQELTAAAPGESADIALLQHSSGTTGLQKGVALSHRAVLNQLRSYRERLDLRDSDVVVSWLPLYHDMGLIAGFLLPILEGIPLVLSSPFDWVRAPWRMLRSVSEYRGTLSWLPNFAFNFMAGKVRDADLDGINLHSWRAIINCSEPVRWESHQAFFERFKDRQLKWSTLQTCYAMAENVFAVTQSPPTEGPSVQEIDKESFDAQRRALPAKGAHTSLRMMSSGRPLSNTEIRIVDDRGETLPDRSIGEITIRSDCMLSGYYNRPDADEKALRDGWYLTGDYGYLSEGELYVVGRKRDLIIVGGKNVYPQDLEALSYEVDGIHPGRSVAFGIFEESLGTEEVYMVAEADVEDGPERERLAEQVRRHVTRHSAIAIRSVRLVGPNWIIKTSSGKTSRGANRAKYVREVVGLTENKKRAPL